MKNFLLGLVGTLLAVFLAVLLFAGRTVKHDGLLGSAVDNVNTAATTSQFLVGNTAQMILSTSTSRTLTRIIATSSGMMIKYSGPGTTSNSQIFASPFVIDLDHMYRGAIWAINSVTGTMSVTEFSQP